MANILYTPSCLSHPLQISFPAVEYIPDRQKVAPVVQRIHQPFSRIDFVELRFAPVLPSGRLKSLRASHSRYFKNATECLAKPNCLTYIRQPDRWSALSKTQLNKTLKAIWIRPCGLYSLLEQAQQPSPSVRNFV